MGTSMVLGLGGVCLVGFTSGCSSQPLDRGDQPHGILRAAIELGASAQDVTAVRFDLVPADSGCDAPALATQTAPLEAELAPATVSGAQGEEHRFASGLFTVAPGVYRACATPLRAESTASELCAAASEEVSVAAEQASQLTLVSQCQGDPTGGVEVAVTLNNPPQITAVAVTESTYITVCESARLAVTAADPDGDALSYDWSIVSGPGGGTVIPSQASATFSGSAGDYVVRVTVTDVHAAQTSFLVTIHVSDATCVVPQPVFDIITAKCSPCHTTGSSGGLKLDPADVAYTSLVRRPVGAAACSSQVRVVPGDAAGSYLIAKLRGAPGICGLPMPRNRPALPEEEIQTIEAWIDSLPR